MLPTPPQRRWTLSRLFALALLLGTALGGSLPAIAQDANDANLEPELAANLDRIARETAALRELPPLKEIDDVLLSPDELLATMPTLISEESDPEELAAQSRSLAALGLIPEGVDLLDLTIRLMGEQAAGYYDPITDEMIVVADGDFGAEEYFYAHEIIHALQDAHLDPNDLMEETESDNSDESLARIALYEGDAVAASNAYVSEHPGLAIVLLREAPGDFPELDTAPGAMSVILVFPYLSGETFVARLISEGGWQAVDAAYADIPASTEQILHPEKYLERDQPVAVSLPEPAKALGEGWRVVDEDTLGEFQTAVLLANFGPGEGFNVVTGGIDLPEAARNAAAGWDGDRFALWEDADGADVLVWRSVWDTPQDARAFSRALAQFNNARLNGMFNGESPDDVALVTDEVAARVLLDGQEVLYIQSANVPVTDSALAALQAAPPTSPAPGPA
jgi:hypothetical protein